MPTARPSIRLPVASVRVLLLATVLTLPACTRQSAVAPASAPASTFDASPTIDVCALVASYQVQNLFGDTGHAPEVEQSSAGAGVAGSCHWTFRPPLASAPVIVSVTVMTPGASSGKSDSPDLWSDDRIAKAEATIGPRSELPNIGSRALLFESRTGNLPQIWIQEGASLVIVEAANVSKLDQLAYAVSHDVAAWKPPVPPASGPGKGDGG